MLKEFLPKLKIKIQKLFQRKQEQEKQPPERKNLSPNLLLPLDTKNLFIKHSPAIVKTTNYVVIIVSGAFLILLFINFLLDRQLTELTKQRDDYLLKIGMNSAVEVRAREINSLINIYKQRKAESSPVAPALEEILAAVEKNAELDSLRYERDKRTYFLTTTANHAVSYAYMISDLLQDEHIDTITIRSVELVTDRRQYVANLELTYK